MGHCLARCIGWRRKITRVLRNFVALAESRWDYHAPNDQPLKLVVVEAGVRPAPKRIRILINR
jgi:hypothetical protein